MTFDELFYYSKINRKNEKFESLKKKIFNYSIKLFLNILLLDFKKVIFYYARILAFYKFKYNR